MLFLRLASISCRDAKISTVIHFTLMRASKANVASVEMLQITKSLLWCMMLVVFYSCYGDVAQYLIRISVVQTLVEGNGGVAVRFGRKIRYTYMASPPKQSRSDKPDHG